MKKLLISFLLLLLLCPLFAGADVVVFKDGKQIETKGTWKENGQIKCYYRGGIVGFPEKLVERIEKVEVEKKIEKKKVKKHVSTAKSDSYKITQGNGDYVISINKPNEGPALLYIRGNNQSRHFAVKGYDANGNMTGLLVNTTKPYNGIVPVDLGKRKNTSNLEISATGSWSVKVYPISTARKVKVPGNTTGSDDDVLWIKGNAKIVRISGNQQSRHFAVKCYDKYGRLKKLLVNTTKPYDGKVLIPKDALLIEISSVGEWNISLQ